jgi:hypothetical protein
MSSNDDQGPVDVTARAENGHVVLDLGEAGWLAFTADNARELAVDIMGAASRADAQTAGQLPKESLQ